MTYRLAGTELRAGRWASARDLYGRVLIDYTTSPFVPDSVFFTGECELSLGNLAEADKRYRTLLSLYSDSPWLEAATFRLSDIAWRQRRPGALRQLDDFISRFPGGTYSGSALRLRGDILLEQKKPAEAAAEYARAIAVLPDGQEKQAAWYSMARAQLSLGRKLEAADSFARAGSGGSAEMAEKAGFQRAVLLAGEGRAAEAIDALQSFLKSFPASQRAEEARRLLGTLLEKKGDREAARSQWDALARGFPASASVPEYLYRRGAGLIAAGLWAPALDDFQRVAKDSAGSAWADRSAYAIGYVYAQRGEFPRALPFFLASRGPRGSLAAAISLFNMGRFDQAATAFSALQVSSVPVVSAGTAALYVGRSLYRMNRLEDAAARLAGAAAALAAEGSPLGADAQYWRGWALLRLRRPAEAYGAFLAVGEGYPADPRRLEALFRAGVCESMQADDASAVALYEQVIDTPPGDAGAGPAIIEQAMYERAQALARLGKSSESAEALEQLARAFPGGRLAAQALYSRAERARAAQRFGDAHVDFLRVARDFPRSTLAPQASYWAAESLRLSGDMSGALEAFWTCLAANRAPGLTTQAVEGFTAALDGLADRDTARQYAQKSRSAPGISVEAAAGVILACADVILPGCAGGGTGARRRGQAGRASGALRGRSEPAARKVLGDPLGLEQGAGHPRGAGRFPCRRCRGSCGAGESEGAGGHGADIRCGGRIPEGGLPLPRPRRPGRGGNDQRCTARAGPRRFGPGGEDRAGPAKEVSRKPLGRKTLPGVKPVLPICRTSRSPGRPRDHGRCAAPSGKPCA